MTLHSEHSDSTSETNPDPQSASAYEALLPTRQKFVDAYLGKARGNATEAARLAGYSRASAKDQGYQLKRLPEIQAAITERLNELAMSAEEVLGEITKIARGSIEDFIAIDVMEETDRYDAEGERIMRKVPWKLSLRKAKAAGVLDLIAELSETEHGPKIKLIPRLDALELLGRHHKLFTDKHEVSGPGGGPVPFVVENAIERIYGSGKPGDPGEDSGGSAVGE